MRSHRCRKIINDTWKSLEHILSIHTVSIESYSSRHTISHNGPVNSVPILNSNPSSFSLRCYSYSTSCCIGGAAAGKCISKRSKPWENTWKRHQTTQLDVFRCSFVLFPSVLSQSNRRRVRVKSQQLVRRTLWPIMFEHLYRTSSFTLMQSIIHRPRMATEF